MARRKPPDVDPGSTLRVVFPPIPSPQTAVYRVAEAYIEVRTWPLAACLHDLPPHVVLMPGCCWLAVRPTDFREEPPPPPLSVRR
jgi:hypothetical protein